MRARLVLLSLLATVSCMPVQDPAPVENGDPLPTATPADVGMSADALAAIAPAMQRYTDDGRTGGIVTLVARRGRLVHWEATGFRDLASQDPLEPDDIFRIMSMTKPITSVAVMMLVEDGAVALDAPVAEYLPEFAEVGVYTDSGVVPPAAPLTVADLLGHTSGLTYGLFGQTPVDVMYQRENVFSGDLSNLVDEVGELPLLFHPGSAWNYSVSTDVLGGLVETVSGQTFDVFLHERLFGPLGMDDTGFRVAADGADRFVTAYAPGPEGLQPLTGMMAGDYTDPVLLSGGGGLASTASDYLRFTQMLLNGGELDGVRLLRAETVERMRTNRLPEELLPIGIATWSAPGYGFGLGFSVLVDEEASPVPDNDGVFRWWGINSTYFWIDPEAELIGMILTQLNPPVLPMMEAEFQTLVYGALEQ